MRTISQLFLSFLFLSLSLPVHAQSKAESLARVLHFKVKGAQEVRENRAPVMKPMAAKLDLFFTYQDKDQVYYQGSLSAAGSESFSARVRAKINKLTGDTWNMTVVLFDESEVFRVKLKDSTVFGDVLTFSERSKVKVESDVVVPGTEQLAYWNKWDTQEEIGGKYPLEVEALSTVFNTRRGQWIGGDYESSGTLELNPCDGCEHGDQLFIKEGGAELDVNVIDIIEKDYPDFYTADCAGEFHAWIEQFIKLNVPVTFSGKVSSLTWDVWEENFWVATSGKLFLGDYSQETGQLELKVLFADLATQFKVSLSDLMKSGKFVAYNANSDVLVFKLGSERATIELFSGEIKIQ